MRSFPEKQGICYIASYIASYIRLEATSNAIIRSGRSSGTFPEIVWIVESVMGSNDTEPLQALESSSIDELWRTSSLPRGSDSPDLFHNAQESIPNAYCSQEQTSEGLELSHIRIDGQNWEHSFASFGSGLLPPRPIASCRFVFSN